MVARIEDHPLPAMLEAGLICTVASDDPSMFGSPLAGEYELCRRELGFDDERLAAVALNGVAASFADETTTEQIEAEIAGWLAT